jgi:hypothetical protein
MSRSLRYASFRYHSHDSLMAEVGLKEEGESKTTSKLVGKRHVK